MTEPSNEDIMEVVEDLIEVAREKALGEATDTYTGHTSIGGSQTEGPTEEEKRRIDEGLAQVKARFKEILTPHPDDFDTMIDTMREVETTFGVYQPTENMGSVPEVIDGSGDLSMLDTAKVYMQEWGGDMSNNLVENYLNPMYPAMTSTHGNLARFLRQNAELMQRVYVRRRKDAKNLAEQSVTAIEAINDSKGGDLAIKMMSVLGGLGGGLAAVVSGPVAPLTATLTASAVGIGTMAGGEFTQDDKEVPLGADTVQGVIHNLYNALDESETTVRDEEDTIIEAMQTIEKMVHPMVLRSQAGKGNELVPIRPDIVHASDGEVNDGLTVYGS